MAKKNGNHQSPISSFGDGTAIETNIISAVAINQRLSVLIIT
ncbi:MAG: hypothetical protein N2235_12040 [Fischerella sp.]|nr:hypothetical protein [Fischerella sp.]